MGHRKKFDMFCEEQKKSCQHLVSDIWKLAHMTVINFWEVKTVNTVSYSCITMTFCQLYYLTDSKIDQLDVLPI